MNNNLDSLFNFAMQYLREKDFIFGYMATLPMKKKNAYRYALGWCVIRYIDEIIDSSQSTQEKTDVLNKYCTLINMINDGLIEKESLADEYELCLYFYLKLDDVGSPRTFPFFMNVLKSFYVDIKRIGKILTWKEYDDYLFYRSDSVLELYYALYFEELSPNILALAKDYARSFQYVDDVCDFFKDYEIGQINITKDEIEKLGITDVSLKNLVDANKFTEYRKKMVLKHYFDFIARVKSSNYSFLVKRYLKESIGYNISPIISKQFYPGKDIELPFKSLILKITSMKCQCSVYKIFNKLMYLYCVIPWYHYSDKEN